MRVKVALAETPMAFAIEYPSVTATVAVVSPALTTEDIGTSQFKKVWSGFSVTTEYDLQPRLLRADDA